MKKIFIFAFFSCFFIYAEALKANEPASIVTLELEDGEDKDAVDNNLASQVGTFMEIGKYFDTNYPGQMIEEDLSEDLEKFFPNTDKQTVFDRADLVRDGVKIYRFFKNTYEEIKQKILTPKPAPIIVSEDEYEKPYTVDYIESSGVVVVEDIKKVVSYTNDQRDIDAYQAKKDREAAQGDLAEKNDLERVVDMFSKIELKKLPYYGIKYDNPIVGRLGIGNWSVAEKGGVAVRLISSTSKVNNQKEIKCGLEMIIPPTKSVLAVSKGRFARPMFDFSKSQNIKDAFVFSPKPKRYTNNDGESITAYLGDLAIPVLVEVEDPKLPLDLGADILLSVCDMDGCENQIFHPSLHLDAGEGYMSVMSTFLTQSFAHLPETSNKSMEIRSVVVDEPTNPAEKPTLRIVIDAHKSVDKFELFIESADGIEFSKPKVSMNNNVIVARVEPLNSSDIKGKEFVITVSIDAKTTIKQTWEATGTSIFDVLSGKLSLTLIFFGVIGGFILNFMPCVFPVLSLKLLAMTKMGARTRISKDFWLTVGGIFASFLTIAIILALMKLAGLAVGWGMQFQNAAFLVVMIFAMTLFMAHIWGTINISVPGKIKQRGSLVDFLSGAFVVLMATPCTAPYLGTAIGFALAGDTLDIFVIMLSVALGLSLPYILVALIPGTIILLPKPGSWMDKLNSIMLFMLFLTIVWLLSVLAAQTSVWASIRLSLYALIFLFLLWYRKIFMDTIETEVSNKKIKKLLRKKIGIYFACGLALFFVLAQVDANYNFIKHKIIELSHTEQKINMDKINRTVQEGRTVLLRVGADWCLTCSYNDVVVFNNPKVQNYLKDKKIEVINIDWTNYNAEVLMFMEKYGRKGLPFYIIFSPIFPDGIVLPEVLSEMEFFRILGSAGS